MLVGVAWGVGVGGCGCLHSDMRLQITGPGPHAKLLPVDQQTSLGRPPCRDELACGCGPRIVPQHSPSGNPCTPHGRPQDTRSQQAGVEKMTPFQEALPDAPFKVRWGCMCACRAACECARVPGCLSKQRR